MRITLGRQKIHFFSVKKNASLTKGEIQIIFVFLQFRCAKIWLGIFDLIFYVRRLGMNICKREKKSLKFSTTKTMTLDVSLMWKIIAHIWMAVFFHFCLSNKLHGMYDYISCISQFYPWCTPSHTEVQWPSQCQSLCLNKQ